MTISSGLHAAEPPIFKPIGADQYLRTGEIPREKLLPYRLQADAVLLRSPFLLLRPSQGCFSDDNGTTELYKLILDDDKKTATLGMQLWAPSKAVRKYEDWMTNPVLRQPIIRGLAWRAPDWQPYALKAGELAVIYQDVYAVEVVASSGVQVKCVTASCPAELKPLPECRPLPCHPELLSPLFYSKARPDWKCGLVGVRRIWTKPGETEPIADIVLYSPEEAYEGISYRNEFWSSANPKSMGVTVKVGETFGIPRLQSYKIRRIVPPGTIDCGEEGRFAIHYGWIEIDAVPASDEQGSHLPNGSDKTSKR